jgi:predicted RNA binding protein YcfA (HicA-like mRNA interferase family)
VTSRPSKKIERALKKNGFVEILTHHKRFKYISLSGKPTDSRTFLSHGSKDYGDRLLSDLAKQLFLSKDVTKGTAPLLKIREGFLML